MSPFTKDPATGEVSWEHRPGDRYLVTGVLYRTGNGGKRFRAEYYYWEHVRGVNLWRGSKWLIRDGKRYLICKVRN